MSSGFEGHGGVCVASCYHAKCDGMRVAVKARGHAMCVSFFPGDEVTFALTYGKLLEQHAKVTQTVIVITGDAGEEGKWQQKEMKIMNDWGIQFQKMTLEEYKYHWPAVPTDFAQPTEQPSSFMPKRDRYYYILPRNSGIPLDVDGKKNGARVQIWSVLGDYPHKHFRFERVEDDDEHYYIIPKHSGLPLDVDGKGNGAKVQTWEAFDKSYLNKHFRFQSVGDSKDHFYIIARHSGLPLDVDGAQNGARVQTWAVLGDQYTTNTSHSSRCSPQAPAPDSIAGALRPRSGCAAHRGGGREPGSD
eukprot:CAMPEP_0171167202 /NCGR_PEP_ID=MMETSP0790-20130122/7083_1 /TAXON_ID=2925 /ORGANISM="Alexandrium catenella, Strain OF101" /LENGTH=302 /DNA_ID=CAMNT_0011632023 /DNA_START=81 /DNA_END=991 /DNA_ORIENTATION=-